MVCDRCVMTVKKILHDLSIPFEEVNLGEVQMKGELNDSEVKQLQKQLNSVGFEIIESRSTSPRITQPSRALYFKRAGSSC